MNPNPEFESLVPAQSFNRRSFLVTSLGAGFALAVQPVMAQTAIKTDDAGLVAGEVKVPVKDGEMAAYRALPQGATKPPVVLVVSEIFGVHEYIKDVCRRLAKLGYCAIAPELFARQGDPRQYSSIPDILAKITSKTPDALVMSDLDATVAWAKSKGADPARLIVPEVVAPVAAIAADLGRTNDLLGSTRTLHLLRYVDAPDDARHIADAAESLGPRVVGTLEILGKSRFMRAALRWSDDAAALIAGLLGTLFTLVSALVSALQSLVLRSIRAGLRRAARQSRRPPA